MKTQCLLNIPYHLRGICLTSSVQRNWYLPKLKEIYIRHGKDFLCLLIDTVCLPNCEQCFYLDVRDALPIKRMKNKKTFRRGE